MTELRIFAVGYFVGVGLFSAAENHGLPSVPGSIYEKLICIGLFAGSLAVAFFGRRAA